MEARASASGAQQGGLVGEGKYQVYSYTIEIQSSQAPEFVDVTDWVQDIIEETGIEFGTVVVYSTHSTAAVVINEMEPLLLEDVSHILEHFAPREGGYLHNDFEIRTVNMNDDEPPNGHAHCQQIIMGTSETIPILDKRLRFGMYQRIFFIELDRPRPRRLVVQVMGVQGEK
ncbi:MAG: secondary thiamine-phosphate synthase enzyme YjbQ [Chloroflexi bacterium]|nr:secondary thiamine-phosphate synthase enzyme YjbQ [Chloroflexota bacterium]